MADTLVDSYTVHDNITDATHYSGSTNRGGTKWIATESCSISQTIWWLHRGGDNAADTIWCKVYADNAGALGTLLGTSDSVSLASMQEGDPGAAFTIPFTTKPSLTASGIYYFVLEGSWIGKSGASVLIYGKETTATNFIKGEEYPTWTLDTSKKNYLEIYKPEGAGTPINIALAVGGS